ncbi:hypothetical protein TNCV_1696941 [Trichonephila clavipes]|nr:hypothetical protein TNCV_1696941 [Trichonephila clavipes]
MHRVRSRNAYEHVFEFDKGRIAVYRYCGLSYRSTAALVRRNPITVCRPRHEPSVRNWSRLQDNKCKHEQFHGAYSSMDTHLDDHGFGYLSCGITHKIVLNGVINDELGRTNGKTLTSI